MRSRCSSLSRSYSARRILRATVWSATVPLWLRGVHRVEADDDALIGSTRAGRCGIVLDRDHTRPAGRLPRPPRHPRRRTRPAAPGPRPRAAGVTVRAYQPGDAHAVHELTEDAFDEWQQRRKPFEEWAAHTVGRSTFAPDASPLAFSGGEVVGAVLSLDLPGYGEGYVESVA